MSKGFYVYILASQPNGTLYVGVTNDLSRRVGEHKSRASPGFTRKYGVDKQVYFDPYDSIIQAREAEYKLKRWRRAWKLALIEKTNPQGRDLTDDLAM